jgi:hypothetical protein
MKQRIKLRTHDRSKNSLVFYKYENGFYLFRLEAEFPTFGIIGATDNIVAIDPVGGPMLSLGDSTVLPGFVLKKIECKIHNPVTLYFKSVKNSSKSIRDDTCRT